MALGLSNEKAYERVNSRVSPTILHPERAEWVRRIFRNLAYLSGIQSFYQNPWTGRLEVVNKPNSYPNKRDFTANLILPYTMRAVSKLVELRAEFVVAPNSDSRQDREAAKIGEKVFQHIRENTRFEDKRMRASLWAATCGLGALKITWDPERGEPERIYLMTKEERRAAGYPDGSDGPPLVDLPPEQQRARDNTGDYKDVTPGDIRCDVVNPFCLHWDWNAKEGGIEASDWIAQVTLVEVEKIKQMYGRKAQNVEPDEHSSEDTLYEEAASVFHGGVASLGRQNQPRSVKSTRCRVTEYFEVPSDDNQWMGRHVIIAGKTVLKNDRNPYAAAGMPIPFVVFPWFPRPGGFVSIDLVGQITDAQRAYNRSAAHAMEVEATNGYPTLILFKNSGVKPIRVPSFPGMALEVNQSVQPPITVPPVNLPPYIAENRETRRREIQEITGQSDPMQGEAPGQVRTTGGVEALINQGESVLTPVSSAHLEAVATCGRMFLKLAGMYMGEERVARIMGEGNQFDVIKFTGADLRGNYDVRVLSQPGSGNQDPSAKVLQLANAGLIDMQDPEMRRLVLDAFHLKSPSLVFDTLLLDQKNAEDENDLFLDFDKAMMDSAGLVPETMPAIPIAHDWEDHNCHIAIHNKLRKSKEYRSMSEQTRRLIDAHVMQHQAFALAIMQAQAQASPSPNAAAPGAEGQPDAKGKASPPRPQPQES